MRSRIRLGFVILAMAAASVPAQDYQLYGHVDGSAGYHFLPGADGSASHVLTGTAGVTADHRLGFRDGELVANHEIVVSEDDSLRHTIREAYLAIHPSAWLSIFAGRQRINWGVGLSLSPSDSLHPTPLVPAGAAGQDTAEVGFAGGSVLLTAGPSATVSIAVSGDQAFGAREREFFRALRYGVGVSGFIRPIEVWVSAVYQDSATLRPGAGLSAGLGPVVVYAEGAVELLNQYGYPSDAATGTPVYASPEPYELFPVLSAGAETRIAIAAAYFTITGEYLYFSPGYTREQARVALATAGMEAASAQSAGLPPLLRQHYGMATLHADFGGYVALDLGALINIEDQSGVAYARGTLVFLEGIDLWLGTTGFYGDQATEFGRYPPPDSLPGRLQIRLGATAYF